MLPSTPVPVCMYLLPNKTVVSSSTGTLDYKNSDGGTTDPGGGATVLLQVGRVPEGIFFRQEGCGLQV